MELRIEPGLNLAKGESVQTNASIGRSLASVWRAWISTLSVSEPASGGVTSRLKNGSLVWSLVIIVSMQVCTASFVSLIERQSLLDPHLDSPICTILECASHNFDCFDHIFEAGLDFLPFARF